jgi:hypothetical protein
MMKNMMKSMGGSAGAGGKGSQFDMNKMNAMMNQNSHKERMRTKLEQRKAQAQAQAQKVNYTLEAKSANEFVFKLPDEEVQEKSKAPPVNDDWLDEPEQVVAKTAGKKGGKGKKGAQGAGSASADDGKPKRGWIPEAERKAKGKGKERAVAKLVVSTREVRPSPKVLQTRTSLKTSNVALRTSGGSVSARNAR